MTYQMKRGNSAVPFKELGSSPVHQIDPLDLGLLDEAKKIPWKGSTTPKNFNIKGSSVEGPITADKYKAQNVKKPILRKIKDVGSKILKHVPKALKIINPLAEAKLTYDIISHGVKNIKEGKAKIPKGHYKKGGKGYKKRDYSKSFDYSGRE